MSTNRVMKNRRKKPSVGRVIRVSDEVWKHIAERRAGRRMSWDRFFRNFLGLPDRNGNNVPLIEGWLEVNTGKLYLKQAEAKGAAVMEAAKQRTKAVRKPIRMREIRW